MAFPPIGLILSPDGVLSGKPTVVGPATFKVCAVGLGGDCKCKEVTINVVAATAPPPVPTPTPTPTPTPPPIACNATTVAGSDAPVTHNIEMGARSGTFTFAYSHLAIADRMVVQYQGTTLYDTGCVGQGRSVSLTYSGTSTITTVTVTPNCAGGTGTLWSFTVSCPR